MARSQFGRRVHALAAHLTGGFRLTHRETARVLAEVFGIEIGVGAMTALQCRVRDVLEAPFREAQRVIRKGFSEFIEETSWRLRRRRAYLWATYDGELVVYRVDRRRNRAEFRRLMAGKYDGARIVDRYVVHDDAPDERMLRPAVLWRKGSFGSHSEEGARFASRILTATRSLRLQGRDVLEFLASALDSHVHGHDPPSLLPAAVTAAA